ncbi:hypothetical protein E4U41_005172, partial [Claviceps citrina]
MNWRKYGKRQPVVGLARRAYDVTGRFLGLTKGTPLQRKLSALAYVLLGCAVVLAMVVFGVNRFKLRNEVIIYATSLGIAIIPESLVAVLTITMVVAVTVMRKANVVVRDLSALEALGGVTNICSDKTGTLTEGAMIVRKAWIPPWHMYTVRESRQPDDPTTGRVTYARQVTTNITTGGGGDGNGDEESEKETSQQQQEEQDGTRRDYDRERSAAVLTFDVPEEKAMPSPASWQPEKQQQQDHISETDMTDELRAFLVAAALCNLATVRHDEDEDRWQTTGEPTEIALQVFAHRFGQGKKTLEARGWRQRAEFPFDSSVKRMSVVYDAADEEEGDDGDGDSFVFTKGAVEGVLERCSHIGAEPITEEGRTAVLDQMTALASQGQRVLAVASRRWKGRFVVGAGAGPSSSLSWGGHDDADSALRHEVEQRL